MADGIIDFTQTDGRSCAVTQRNKTLRTVSEEIAARGVPNETASRAAEIYQIVAAGDIRREKPRRQLQFYATYLTYIEMGQYRDPSLLAARMSVDNARRAFTCFSTNRHYPMPIVSALPHHFIREYAEEIMLSASLTEEAYKNVKILVETYPGLRTPDPPNKGINPCRAAAAMLYLFCTNNKIPLGAKDLTLSQYTKALHITDAAFKNARRAVLLACSNKPEE